MKTLATKYDDWLAAHCTPQRTASGSVSRSRGVVRYELPDDMPKLLGGSYLEPADKLRQGKDVPSNVRLAVEELVRAWDRQTILRLRRDQAVVKDLGRTMRFAEEFGRAPDGKSLEVWARRFRRRVDADFGCEDLPLRGEAAAMWFEIFGSELAPANQRRRVLNGVI